MAMTGFRAQKLLLHILGLNICIFLKSIARDHNHSARVSGKQCYAIKQYFKSYLIFNTSDITQTKKSRKDSYFVRFLLS